LLQFNLSINKYKMSTWEEGYDYPSDDECEERDYHDQADEQHDKYQDDKL
tara:strand:+ start:1576 stop:1725 length:150 start_codon:yes stop_codon:yes gene_type:complete